ncbi:hypothetical protein HXX25_00480 [Hyphobacterium sp. CCMP332]|uniref:hypothetical protein n=1 Tax=Hyphobacterium sp. CCMP332 TaxID=2749086 RepID=UPI00164F61AC|nr:hypothetical protein [Hyphobacterium sp. CCMP332]QNL17941.1 hypothetical protein HXX25_00480 [Hyphobacterium sp. CCMP332]
MILDNLSRALKTQNWLAAGVEFVIVIAGVVIGFQINALNEGRQARHLEAEYLYRLEVELTAVIEDLNDAQRAIDAYFNWIGLFLEGVEEGDRDQAQAGSWGLNAITDVEMINLEPASLREMISAGDLTIIQNRALRSDLASIPQLQSRSQASLQQMAADLTPVAFEISRQFEARLEDVADFSAGGYDQHTIQFDFDAVSQNEVFLNRVNYAALQNRFQAAHFVRYRSEIEAIRERVRSEIEMRGFG